MIRPLTLLSMLALSSCALGNSALVSDGKQGAEVGHTKGASDQVRSEAADVVGGTAMGPVCWAAIVEAVSGYGERCLASEQPEFREALNSSREKLDRKFRSAGWSEQTLAAFKEQMSEADKPEVKLCSNKDAEEFYRHLEAAGAAKLEAETDRQVARPGQPQWGTCL